MRKAIKGSQNLSPFENMIQNLLAAEDSAKMVLYPPGNPATLS